MPGQTQYLDTPVVPTSAFSEGYNHPDCAYPDATPAVSEVDGDGKGPWVGAGTSSVGSVTLTAGGSGYTGLPSVTIAAPGAGGTRATASVSDLKLFSISVTNGGRGYTSAPAVTITGGTGATATATIKNGSVTGITVVTPGSGFTSAATVSIAPSPLTGRLNSATATASMAVNTIDLTGDGSGYTTKPGVTITGARGSGATATAALGTSSQILTINALGNQNVINNGYSGPQATTAPFNQKTVTRNYSFGTQCISPTAGSPTCNTMSAVTIDGKTAAIKSWGTSQIIVTVPQGVSPCAVQQQAQYGGSEAQCGQLVITAGNGKQSIDAVTVTIGGKAPTYVTGTIQSAIDAAAPGDLIMVPAGVYNEMLLMWKPVRLQGVAAASTIINANAHPAGKLDPWRYQVNCLFGLALNGQPYTSGTNSKVSATNTNPFDSTGAQSCPGNGWQYFTGGPNNPQVDRLPLEGILGWDTTVNGNLAQLLQEPTLMGAYEGAGITVLGKGVNIPAGSTDVFGSGAEATFPTGSTLLTNANCNGYSSNFQCNPSSIDGLSITDSSQGGGGIFVHAWGHNLQIANNRVYNNAGTLTGGITIGQGESPDAYLVGATPDSDPGSCSSGFGLPANVQLPYCFDTNVNIHNNQVTLNSSIGDELYSSTPAGAGGVTICTGADYYQFKYNWVCGNLSTGDGGGLVHLGFTWNGDIEHNQILFNQSTNPTVPTNGGGLIVMGAPPDGTPAGAPAGTECGSTAADADCTPGLSDGTGPGLVINANLFMGNAAESGSGGGIRFQNVNGTEVTLFPNQPSRWNSVNVTNNIIVNNVAGWDGAGVSLEDALVVNLVNNTIMSNDTTASAGPLFNTIGAPLASSPGPGLGGQTTNGTTSLPQPAGLVTMQNTPQLTSTLGTTKISCPPGHGSTTLLNNPNGPCNAFSIPLIYNDVISQNRSFYIGVGSLSAQYQQNIVSLYNSFVDTPATNQPSTDATTPNGNGVIVTGGTGACVTGTSYWDIGVRGDQGPNDHHSGLTLNPVYSMLSDITSYGGGNNTAANPQVVSQYCDGSRTPPEFASGGFQVPPGISDATVPNPIFNLTPNATVDEGNNWVNISWGPLAETNPTTGATLGNYSLAAGSPAINYIPALSAAGLLAPKMDYFNNPRPSAPGTPIDIGAVEFQGTGPAAGSVSPTSLAFGNQTDGTTGSAKTLSLSNTGGADLTGINIVVAAPFSRPTGTAGGTCGATLTAAAGTCTINIVFSPTTVGPITGSVTITANVTVSGSPVALTGTGVASIVSATLTPTTWTPAHSRNCPGLACLADPAQGFTLTNTGNVTLTGITQGSLSGPNTADYALRPLLSNCGPAGNGQLGSNITLAPGATCNIEVQFQPLTSEAAGTKTVTVSVTDAAGTQSVIIKGNAQ